ncbi:hypothetical protein [Streptomyces sp. NPDC085596]|uniref:hypothetical protein n=1 Tax=Streptomyces sp. NPDC085596 TaxID=3365731 RepID=UPI0037D47385
MKLPFVTRARYEKALAEIDGLRRRVLDTEARHDQAEGERRRIASQYVSLEEQYTNTVIVNACLTDDLAKAKARLAEYGGRRTVPDVLEEHDVHRKALADTLGDQKLHLNWDQLIAEVARLNGAAVAWMADHDREKRRADGLQKQLDDALGLNTTEVAEGSKWQARRESKLRWDK